MPANAGSAGGAAAVERIHEANSTGNDVIVLRLAEPLGAAPLPLGYASLVRVGDQVQAPMPTDDGGAEWQLQSGVVDSFGLAPGRDARRRW